MKYVIYLLNGECVKTNTTNGKEVFEIASKINGAVFFSIKPYYWVNGQWAASIK